MCRLLAIQSATLFDPQPYLEKFAAICRHSRENQGHGWGCAWLVDHQWKFYKNIHPIWDDCFEQPGKTRLFLAHARSAFRDEGIMIENNMPFYTEDTVFIFNGELRGVKIKIAGRIGAEKIFNYIQRFNQGCLADALQKGSEIIVKRCDYVRAMNIIMSDKQELVLHSLFNEDDDYFTMYRKKTGSMVIVCSDPFENETDWDPIQNHTIEVIK
jgi:glutamine amidotransferase